MSAIVNERRVIDSLYRISSLVGSTEDPKEALQFILDEVMGVFRPASACISLVNPDTERLQLEAITGVEFNQAKKELKLGEGITGWVALHGKPLLVPDVSQEARYIPIHPNIQTEMAVPLEEQNQVIGVLNVESDRPDAFQKEDLKILTLLANEATKVVSKLWLITQLKLKADLLQGLVSLGQNLGGTLQQDWIIDYLTEEAQKLLRSTFGALFLLSPDRKRLHLASLYEKGRGKVEQEEEFLLEESVMGACVQFEKLIEIPDMFRTDEGHFRELVVNRDLHSMLACPILTDEGVFGTVHVYTTGPRRFNNDEKQILQTLCRLGGVAIQNVRLYQRVFSSQETLRKNEKLTTLGLLAAEIAHEVRNPLTVIKLLFQSLDLDFPEDEAKQKDLTIISEKLVQLEETVGRVLSFGKTRQDMHARYNLVELIGDTLTLVRLKCRQNQIALLFEPETDPLFIECNKGQVQQGILNLIINSIEAIGSGGEIRIRAVREAVDPTPVAVIYISDTGLGVAEEIQGQIFDSFLTRKKGGTGLGLSIVKRIMRSHRGDIKLVETGPQGTTFRIWLPLTG
jgi:signal transduction histidine kinase